MTRLWTVPAVAGVVAAVLTVWLVRACQVLAADGWGATVVTAPTLLLVYAAGPAVLCAVPLVLIARTVLGRAGRSLPVHAGLGLLCGLLVGVVQTGVLLSSWPWQVGGVADELIGLPALGGLVGGVVAGLVARRLDASERPGRPDAC
ncbi:conserved hypothetical protein [Cellulomonas flavigena DSM 20109]|uniref:Uncharacterized protein n=1 Tax=Cellulomonas flavigena (strain ATCC 482 / DSM 20109 / BCRC 11376 / JCM 18109 / NBRC 3775 / NCIMB 8073 / NRS 134) TaxID=446466 RepID=D5ULE0_CELFN|nr:hypothetical protein [Cellulomonas flavigena]ADG73982.1 conserved hypothetical protein [Cellulomonas flavigena DSM 20109]